MSAWYSIIRGPGPIAVCSNGLAGLLTASLGIFVVPEPSSANPAPAAQPEG